MLIGIRARQQRYDAYRSQDDDIPADDSSCIQENNQELPSCIDQAIASPSMAAAVNESPSPAPKL